MYLEYFELNEFPFTLTPNTGFYCALPSYNNAINLIKLSLENGEGFIKIIGEVGTGKTLLCRKILNELDPTKYVTAYIANPNLDHATLYEAIIAELGIPYLPKTKQHELLKILNNKLLELYQQNKHVVVVIDEAQVLADKLLEAIRLLSNLETESSKLLHIVLFGQPELDNRLKKVKLRQLRQRIAFSYYLTPLTQAELNDYIYHRLKAAGYKYGSLFSKTAHKLIFKATNGTPRLVNVLCHKALLACYGYGKNKVTVKSVLLAIKDTESSLSIVGKHLIYGSVLFILIATLGIEAYYALRLFL